MNSVPNLMVFILKTLWYYFIVNVYHLADKPLAVYIRVLSAEIAYYIGTGI